MFLKAGGESYHDVGSDVKSSLNTEEEDTVQSDVLTLKRQKKTFPTAFFSRKRKSYWYHKRHWVLTSQASIWRRTMVGNVMVKARSCSMLCQTVPSHSSHFSAISNLTIKWWWTAEEAKCGVSERHSCVKPPISINNGFEVLYSRWDDLDETWRYQTAGS